MSVALRRLRTQHGLTQDEAAALADVSPRSYKGYELGERPMPVRPYSRLMTAYSRMHGAERTSPPAPNGSPLSDTPPVDGEPPIESADTDGHLVIERPPGTSDAEWDRYRARAWEDYARWVTTRVRRAVDDATTRETQS